ncbi:MAG: hypothetical protein ACI35Z_04230 [Sphingobacterium hotanense]
MSANFQHVLGMFNLREQLDLFFSYQDYAQRRSEATLLKTLNESDDERHALSLLRPQPRMWVSYHLGVYQSIPIRLMAAGISVCLIVSRNVLKEYETFYSKLTQKISLEGRLCFQEAEDPHIFFRLRRHVEMGYDIFVFADGAFGSDHRSEPKLEDIKLLNGTIKVRSGYTRIAQLLSLRITKIVERSLDCRNYAQLEIDQLCFENENNVDILNDQSLQRLYQSFGGDLACYPHMWETWRYLHRYFHPRSELETWDAEKRIIPIELDQQFNLLDKFTYRVHEINRTQYERLSKLIF